MVAANLPTPLPDFTVEADLVEADLPVDQWIYIGMSVENVCRLWGEPYMDMISDEKPQVTYYWFNPLRYVTFSIDTEVWRVVNYMGYYKLPTTLFPSEGGYEPVSP